jgi:peptide/nickel transport system permease protein
LARYIAKRLIMALVTVLVVISLSFFMVHLMPGNPMEALQAQLSAQGGLSQAAIQAKVNLIYGILPREPLWEQYLGYIGHAFAGNLGRSVTNPGETVVHVLANALPWTLFSVAVSLIISFVLGISIGSLMATFQDRWFAKLMTFIASFLSAIPSYLIAIVLLFLLADMHPVFPSGGAYSVSVTPAFDWQFISSAIYHAILPILSYVIISFGGWALAMKGTAVSVLGSEYVRAAEARGLSGDRIAQSYVGRNSMLPQITSLALSIGFMFGGSVFIETYFAYPGIGYYMIEAVDDRDYPVMMGCFLVITVAVVVCNLLVDLLYPVVDPRIAGPAGGRRLDMAAKQAGGSEPAPLGSAPATPVGGSMS